MDPNGKSPKPGPAWSDALLKKYNSTLYDALWHSNNTSPLNFYNKAVSGNGWDSSNYGAVGEAVVMGYLDKGNDSKGLLSYSFGKKYNGYQVDIQQQFTTWDGGIIGTKSEVYSDFSSYDGNKYKMDFDSKLPVTWTLNFEVKAFGSGRTAESLYNDYLVAFDQVSNRTSSFTSAVGVLVTDYDAWMKVVNDEVYGPLLKEKYEEYFNEDNDDGGKLMLIKGLSKETAKQYNEMQSIIKSRE